ncbi:hypothetical protein [Sphaerotilus mobilis]|uniref:Uncharacterized protein n=1 Tax=Sphaerotilus mobilis TaxID=47994 RepID=A0A4Q7LUB8_9BURK|nr:hypothetical protein [Sphaerotilus mobilis]RZS58111.1 hypothetical protein EV685_0390 [Sphaerotilus mobilis]
MDARQREAQLLIRCTAVARDVAPPAADPCEAHVFPLAARVVQSRFPVESSRLLQASERYVEAHPDTRLASADVVRQGWIVDLPRLRDLLSHELGGR